MTVRALDELITNAPDLTWLDDAACGELPLDELDQFFVEAGRTISARTVALCAGCPVRVQCLDHGYERHAASGYFGGMSPSKRRSISHAEARRLVAGTETIS